MANSCATADRRRLGKTTSPKPSRRIGEKGSRDGIKNARGTTCGHAPVPDSIKKFFF